MANGETSKFDKLADKLASKGATDPRALAAYIGKKKYGAAGMAKKAAAGKKAAKTLNEPKAKSAFPPMPMMGK